MRNNTGRYGLEEVVASESECPWAAEHDGGSYKVRVGGVLVVAL